MDKQRKEHISIRINGKERVFLSDEELNREISAANEKNGETKDTDDLIFKTIMMDDDRENDFSNNIIDFETKRLKRNNSMARVTKNLTQTFERNKPNLLKKRKKRFSKFTGNQPVSHLNKVVAIILSAIVIGTGFGYVVLSLFTDISEEQLPSGNGNIPSNGQAINSNNINNIGTTNPENSGAESTIASNNIAPLDLEIIQGGAFASLESAKEFAENLKDSGTAAIVLPESNPVLMFIGLGTNREELNDVSQSYIEKGQDVYIKSFKLNGIESSKLTKAEDAVFIASGVNLYQSLVQLSAQTFQTKSIEKSSWGEITTNYNAWQKTMPKELPASLKPFVSSITNAYQSLASYQSNPNDKNLWKSQQVLLDGLLSYKKWHDLKMTQ